ncbi:MAG: MSMEG_0568 family radical SAM protein [Candidatus Helarchaeota archaeon]
MVKNIAELKIELMSLGMRSEPGAFKGRKRGAGPAGGRFFQFKDDSCANVPLWPHFTTKSPYELRDNLVYLNNSLFDEVMLLPVPQFHSKLTSDNIPMRKIALLHGTDCVASTVVQSCMYWKEHCPCQFCGIELSLHSGDTTAVKTPQQLREVIGAAIAEGVCKHITLTIGSVPSPDKGATIYSKILQEIKQYYDIPIHVQLEPPEDTKYLEQLHESGADTVGIHIESFDLKVLHTVCPGKTRISIENYKKAWQFATDLFGECQVDSYMLVGLGESDRGILEGSKLLLELGVIPYVVPFRPISGTPLEAYSSPSSNRLIDLFTQLAVLLHDYGVNPTKCKAGCVRCGACSPLTEAYKYLV